jgi:hypothetical protein
MVMSALNRGIFLLVGFDEGGLSGSPENLRLVCNVASGGKLAIWGKEGSRRNIDAVLEAGLPCTVESEWLLPNPVHAEKFDHTYWVREDLALRVVTS